MTKINSKIKVGLNTLDCCNKWISVSEIAFLSDVTPRQVLPALAHIPNLNIKVTKRENCRFMLLTADEQEQKRIFLHIMSWKYDVPDIVSYLMYFIPYSGWVSVKDLSSESGIKSSDLSMIIRHMDGIKTKTNEKAILSVHLADSRYNV